MNNHGLLEQILAISSPFDEAETSLFDPDLFHCGPTIEPLPIWTGCGRRVELELRCLGWTTLAAWQQIRDPEAVWNGTDDAAWEANNQQLEQQA